MRHVILRRAAAPALRDATVRWLRSGAPALPLALALALAGATAGVVMLATPGARAGADMQPGILGLDAASFASPAVLTATTTTLTASPSPATSGTSVTLTATVQAADGTSPAGTVQFEAGGTDIGGQVPVNTGGVSAPATTITTFPAAGTEALSAVFTPTATAYAASTGTDSLAVAQAGDPTAGTVPESVAVPATGTFTVTVSPGAVTLAPAAPATTPDETATGDLQDVTVQDSRNTVPGWSVSGQESNFAGSGPAATDSISGNALGWTPTAAQSLVDGATLGGTVAPAGADSGSTGPGLGTAPGTLAYAAAGCGFGTNVLSASLLLDIPAATPPGPYAGTITITYIEAQPAGVAGCETVGGFF
jgi:hypothetical protein